MLDASQTRRCALLLVGLVSVSACVDKAPPATWPEPPPPVLAKPVGGSEVGAASGSEPAEPSKALEGTNDPSEGSVSLEAAEAEPVEAPEASTTPIESEATPK